MALGRGALTAQVLLAESSVEDGRAKTELAKDAATVAYLEGTRGSEDTGQRRFAAAKTDRIFGGED
jgi:hypothetical protein